MSETSGEDDAVRAFEGLKSEVVRLRQGIELVYRQSQEASVDYSPTLGEMAKTLQAVQSRLTAIEGRPALGVTPQMFRQQIDEAGQRAGEQVGRAMVEGAAAQSAATRELQALVGQARTRKDQHEWLAMAVGAGIIVGIVLVRVLVAVLPWGGGDGLAAIMVGARNPWEAGEILMHDADSATFDKMVQLYNTCGARPVAFCTAAIVLDEAAKAGTGSGAEALPRPPVPAGQR